MITGYGNRNCYNVIAILIIAISRPACYLFYTGYMFMLFSSHSNFILLQSYTDFVITPARIYSFIFHFRSMPLRYESFLDWGTRIYLLGPLFDCWLYWLFVTTITRKPITGLAVIWPCNGFGGFFNSSARTIPRSGHSEVL